MEIPIRLQAHPELWRHLQQTREAQRRRIDTDAVGDSTAQTPTSAGAFVTFFGDSDYYAVVQLFTQRTAARRPGVDGAGGRRSGRAIGGLS